MNDFEFGIFGEFNLFTALWQLDTIGYVATLIVVISFLQRGELKIRLVNAVGAAIFILYGLLISSMPIVALNAILCAINAYYITRMVIRNS